MRVGMAKLECSRETPMAWAVSGVCRKLRRLMLRRVTGDLVGPLDRPATACPPAPTATSAQGAALGSPVFLAIADRRPADLFEIRSAGKLFDRSRARARVRLVSTRGPGHAKRGPGLRVVSSEDAGLASRAIGLTLGAGLAARKMLDAGEWPCVRRCGTCRCWSAVGGGFGECWSLDRLDGDASRGPAGITVARDSCEAYEFPGAIA